MPFININTTKKLSDEAKNALQTAIVENISVFPGKTKEFTTINIIDGCAMYKNGQSLNGAFIEVRIFRNTTEQAKKEFANHLFDVTSRILETQPSDVHINYLELQEWGVGGVYKKA